MLSINISRVPYGHLKYAKLTALPKRDLEKKLGKTITLEEWKELVTFGKNGAPGRKTIVSERNLKNGGEESKAPISPILLPEQMATKQITLADRNFNSAEWSGWKGGSWRDLRTRGRSQRSTGEWICGRRRKKPEEMVSVPIDSELWKLPNQAKIRLSKI